MAALLDPATVGSNVRDRGTRQSTLEALEAHAMPIPTAAALAAAGPLFELLALDAVEVPREVFDRAGLLVGRLCAEALPRGAEAEAEMFGAALGGGQHARFFGAESNVIAEALRKPAAELTRADARSWACWVAHAPPGFARGATAAWKAAGFATTLEFFALVSPPPVLTLAVPHQGLTARCGRPRRTWARIRSCRRRRRRATTCRGA